MGVLVCVDGVGVLEGWVCWWMWRVWVWLRHVGLQLHSVGSSLSGIVALQIPPSVPLCTNYCPIIVEHLVMID